MLWLQAIDKLLSRHVSDNLSVRLGGSRNMSQIAQLITNVEYFEVACTVLEDQLMKLR